MDGDRPALPQLRLVDPGSRRVPGLRELPSSLALMVASGIGQSKAALGRESGLPRSTVSAAVDALLARGLLHQHGVVSADRGRPADRLLISPDLGVVLTADVGAAHVTLAVSDLNLTLLGHESYSVSVRDSSPEAFLEDVARRLWELSGRVAPRRNLGLCVLGLPARIDARNGWAVRPPLVPQWDAFDAPSQLSSYLGCPVIVENDVNLRALGESAALPVEQRPLLSVKVGTGIGAGFIDASGVIYHGYDGSAGEIGHAPLRQGPSIRCYCGNVGCLEVVAAVPGMLKRLQELAPRDTPTDTVEGLIARLRAGETEAHQVVADCGEALGEVLAALCNALNPRRLVIGGLITQASDDLLASVRTAVYRLARPLATRNLIISHSTLGNLAGVAGGMVLGTGTLLSPRYLADGLPTD